MTTNLDRIYAFVEKELATRDWACPACGGDGKMPQLVEASWVTGACGTCGGDGYSPAITEAEEALEACRVERVRVGRLLGLDWELIKRLAVKEGEWDGGELFLSIANALAEYNAPVEEETYGND